MKASKLKVSRNNFDSSTGKLEISGNTIPIPRNFKYYLEGQDLFIVNPEDGSTFKWVQVMGVLKKNGLTGKRKTEYGRRDFDGFFKAGFDDEHYHETCDRKFIHCVRKYGGFYISVYKARYDQNGQVTYTGNGKLVDRIMYKKARNIALRYMIKPDSTRDYITDLPCGAAMDCIAEYAFELLEKEVLEKMLPGEKKSDAWNRIEESKNYKEIGVYGIQDFFTGEAEFTTEVFSCAEYSVATREGNRGLFTICMHNFEEKLFETGKAIYFELGVRNFKSKMSEFRGFGFRLMLLPL